MDASPPPIDTPRDSRDPGADDVMAQLSRILASAEFAQSDRLKKFLRFVVEETLGGRAAALKEYAIAIDVFERDETFDPQTSSIVRVEASRLRTKLEKYYATEGQADPVRVRLPPGRYVPAFDAVVPDSKPAAKTPVAATPGWPRGLGAKRGLALLGLMILGVGAAAVLLSDWPLVPIGSKPGLEADRQAETYSVAVLPLRNLSPDAADEYFSDGITDALITGLAKGGRVRVISMTSAMAYKDVDRRIPDIARELGVSHVVEGAVQRLGDKVRITAQLIEAKTDRHLWAESYEGDVANALALQDDVARRVEASLAENLDAVPAVSPQRKAAVDPEAQEAYLRGRYFRNQMTEGGFRKAIGYFKQAITKAPEYAEAYSGMAACYCLLGGHGFELVEPRQGMPAAKQAVMEALRLDSTLAEPHAFLGIIRLKYEWDWSGAEEAFLRALEINPSYAQGHIFYSFFLEAMGRQEEAIREAEAAKLNDPLSLPANVNLAWQYLRAGRLEQAFGQLEKTGELQTDFWGVHWGLGHYYRQLGKNDEAITAFEKAVEVGGGYTLPMTDLGYTYAIAGRSAAAREMLGQLETMAEQSYVSPYNMAIIHVGLGEVDEAFAWLEKAFEARSRSLAWLRVTTELDGLRSDPRFDSLLRRVGLSD